MCSGSSVHAMSHSVNVVVHTRNGMCAIEECKRFLWTPPAVQFRRRNHNFIRPHTHTPSQVINNFCHDSHDTIISNDDDVNSLHLNTTRITAFAHISPNTKPFNSSYPSKAQTMPCTDVSTRKSTRIFTFCDGWWLMGVSVVHPLTHTRTRNILWMSLAVNC